ncbi:lactonase family protein [Jiangella rhizosphaerae]|uniref:Lactonase family protein n=1 Tax=Jiangella rhizosphaerae TaxID=2293569 RepID=A0A418KM24_9ACTN|nr:lactonase family protein [Jiangella rhizosphaerae]RIQ18985.1 lactonase family protein [Jiangella rhizosphaerae]
MSELVCVGTFTPVAGGRGTGIHTFIRDPRTGELTSVGPPAPAEAPTFLAGGPDGRVLYALDGWERSGVRAFGIAASGALRDLGRRPAGGAVPCHLAVAPDGRHVLATHYGSGSVSVHRVGRGGRLAERTDLVSLEGSGPDAERQDAAHPHHVHVAPDGTVRVTDLGADAVRAFRLRHGRLVPGPVTPARPGSGPRHLAEHPDGRLFVANELDSTVSVFVATAAGDLRERATMPATIAPPRERSYPSEIVVSPDGRFVYVANRGANTVTTFGVTAGALEPVAETGVEGEWPRHIARIGDHLYAANERSDSVAIFAVDPRRGVPEFTGRLVDVASPACVVAVRPTRTGRP